MDSPIVSLLYATVVSDLKPGLVNNQTGVTSQLPFEGDIKLLPEDRAIIDGQQGSSADSRRNVIGSSYSRSRLWPNGEVHYVIAPNVGTYIVLLSRVSK